ncbi:MAG: hypothetical protein EXQ56_09940 [Acidobacteria bacterium]|nr:hypothetical protein [Acidobacteriota bacterium]
MQRPTQPRADDQLKMNAEKRVLRFLCQAAADAVARAEVMERLRQYRFASVPHQVLFDCLKALPAARPELVEALLPARLVRAGFPDFDLEPFLRPSGMSAAQARVLCQRMAGGAGE